MIDCIWFSHSRRIIIKGTEDMEDEYHNYVYHIKESLKGMVIGIPVCFLTGILVMLFSL